MPVNGKPSNGKFQLSLAPINYSLTDGTNIPPPPDSPIEEKPPPPAAISAKPEPINTSQTSITGGAVATNGNGNRTTIVANDVPTSPTRPSSIRRFLSRKSLNTNYNNGTNHNNAASQEDLSRPDTSGSFPAANGSRPGVVKQKSGSWFRKLAGGGGGGNRNSVLVVMEEKQQQQPPQVVKKGPPPPKLPELNQLKARIPEDDEGSLGGGDMFKNIQ